MKVQQNMIMKTKNDNEGDRSSVEWTQNYRKNSWHGNVDTAAILETLDLKQEKLSEDKLISVKWRKGLW